MRSQRRGSRGRGWRRWPVVLAWALWALVLLGLAVLAWLDQSLRRMGRTDLLVIVPSAAPPLLGAVGSAAVGAVVAGRRPRHPVGWLMLGLGLALSLAGLAVGYTNHVVAQAAAPPAATLVAFSIPVTIVVAVALNSFILLLTPGGSLPPGRGWRWFAWVTAATPVVLEVVVALAALAAEPGARQVHAVRSPLDLDAIDGGPMAAYQVAFAVGIAAFVAAVVSLVARSRRAVGVERQQLRWVALAAVVVALLGLVHLTALALGAFDLAPLAGGLNPMIVSAAIGAAVLRYRLYDLDRIISRVLAYGLLTVLLGGGYALVVLSLGQLLGAGRQAPGWAVAAATLAAAALFQPARRRIQAAVDRRFNRRRYDAALTIAAFSSRLREEVSLDALSAELLDIVERTMEPTQAALWLPGPAALVRDRPV